MAGLRRGIALGDEPTEAERLHIEAEKAKIIAKIRENGESARQPNHYGPRSAIKAAPTGLSSCPECKTPFGTRKRCYKCHPGHPKGSKRAPKSEK